MSQTALPLLVEIAPPTWTGVIKRAEPWLATVTMLQTTYREMLEDTVPDVDEPHLRAYLEDLLAAARDHEAQIDDLYREFGFERGGSGAVKAAATLVAKTRQAVGHVEGLAGGAKGSAWRKLRELLLSNLDAISGFAVAEQLGLALGNPGVVAVAFPIVEQKTEHQLLLREIFLEMAANAILYERDV
jgi:hypothetical protein